MLAAQPTLTYAKPTRVTDQTFRRCNSFFEVILDRNGGKTNNKVYGAGIKSQYCLEQTDCQVPHPKFSTNIYKSLSYLLNISNKRNELPLTQAISVMFRPQRVIFRPVVQKYIKLVVFNCVKFWIEISQLWHHLYVSPFLHATKSLRESRGIDLLSFQTSALLLLSVGPAKSRLAHCSLSRFIMLNPVLVPQFISRGAPRQTAWETSISDRRKYGREMAG
jgi:hypothetical protein